MVGEEVSREITFVDAAVIVFAVETATIPEYLGCLKTGKDEPPHP